VVDSSNRFVFLFGALALLCLLLIIWLLPYQSSDSSQTRIADQVVYLSCDVSENPCVLNLPQQLKMTLSVSPAGMPALKPLAFQLKIEAQPVSPLTLEAGWLNGKTMDMGRHFLTLHQQTNRQWELQGMIPVCTVDPEMVWQMTLQYRYQDTLTELQIDTVSDSRNH